MKIALFSDVHGRLRIVLHLIRCWQLAHKAALDGALIAGDLGCFPDPSKLDRATQRWTRHDPEEAGFATFFAAPDDEVQAMIDETPEHGPLTAIRCPIVFVAGNHEDYNYLETASHRPPATWAPANTFPVDCYGAFHCIQNGTVIQLIGRDSNRLRVAGLWGIETTKNLAPYRMDRRAVDRLLLQGRDGFDVLLTHDAPFEAYPRRRGSRQVAEIIHACAPTFHVFGHVHPDGRHEYRLPEEKTCSWIMEDLGFGQDCAGSLEGSMAVLEWHDGTGHVELVADSWLREMRHHNWRNIWP